MRETKTKSGPLGARDAGAMVVALALAALFSCSSPGGDFAISWAEYDDTNTAALDHSEWQAILDGYLRTDNPEGINLFDYGALEANAGDRNRLQTYLKQLEAVDPRAYSRDEQMAYWINFYNALTVKVVTESYPVDSIRDIGEGLGSLIGTGPWSDEVTEVAGVALTLDNIEHNILRPIWQDPRIHYAVNCASHGCPNLSKTAYTAANLEEQLEAGAAEYVNHLRGVDLIDEDFMVISSIYTWFVEDFGDSEEGVLAHLTKYAEDDLAESLGNFAGVIEYEYDWQLNDPGE